MVTTNQNPTKGHTKNKENRTQTNKQKKRKDAQYRHAEERKDRLRTGAWTGPASKIDTSLM